MQETAVETPPLTQRQIRIVFAGMIGAMGLSSLDGTVVNTALATIVGELGGGGYESYAWVGTAYLLTSTVVTPLFAKLSDVYGRKLFVQLSMLIFIGGSLLCGVAQSMFALVVARAIQGIGGGGIGAMSMVVIADIVPPRERGRYMGAFMSVFAFSSVAGPLIGGFFTESLTWRWLFFINLPLGLASMWLSTSALKLPVQRRRTDIDLPGALMLTVFLALTVLVISWSSETYGWLGRPSVTMLGVAAVMLAAFLWWEPRAVAPIVPLRLFRNRVLQTVLPLLMIAGAIISAVSAFIPLFLQSVTGVSPTVSGLLMTPMMAGLTFTGVFIGRRLALTGRYRRYPIVGMTAAAAGLFVLTGLDPHASGVVRALVGMFLLGNAIGATMPVGSLAVQNAVDPADTGVASSLVILFRSLGSTISLAMFQAVLNSRTRAELGNDPTLLGYLRVPRRISSLPEPARTTLMNGISNAISHLFAVALVLAGIGFVISLFVEERELRGHAAPVPTEVG